MARLFPRAGWSQASPKGKAEEPVFITESEHVTRDLFISAEEEGSHEKSNQFDQIECLDEFSREN